jgi:hypothetical protein
MSDFTTIRRKFRIDQSGMEMLLGKIQIMDNMPAAELAAMKDHLRNADALSVSMAGGLLVTKSNVCSKSPYRSDLNQSTSSSGNMSQASLTSLIPASVDDQKFREGLTWSAK